MLFNTLILELGDCTMSILPKTDLKTDFAQIQVLAEPREHYSNRVLYFCKWTELISFSSTPDIFVVILDDRNHQEIDDLEYLNGFKGGLVFPSEREFKHCFQCFENVYLRAYEYDQLIDKISETVYNNENIQILANQIAELFDHPINLVDNSFSVLTSSNNYEFFSEDLIRDNQSGFIPPEIIRQLNIATKRRRNSQSKTTVIDHIGGQFQNYFTPVVFNEIALGYFSVFVPPREELSPLLRNYLTRVATLLGIYLQKADISRSSRSNYYTTLLSTLLSENPQLNEMEEDRFQVFGYQMKKFKYIYVVDIAQENPEDYILGDLSSAFKRIFGNCVYTVQHNQIIYLASYDTLAENLEDIIERSENQLLSTPYVHVGVGSPFTVLSEARGHYLEARAAIDAGIAYRSKEHVFLYDKYRLYHMVQVLGSNTDIRMFSLPQLKLLKEHDQIHKSDLLNTLYVYVENAGDIGTVCDLMHVHRNTLYFRLNKIREITDLDLSKGEDLSMIMISLIISKL